MISRLRGIIQKNQPGEITVDVHGVGYGVHVPVNVWDEIQDGSSTLIHTVTYVREDRLDLFGFTDLFTKQLFEELIQISGIGPKMGLELCSVPRSMLLQAVNENDPSVLTAVKGIGKRTAEKLLLELKSLADKLPSVFTGGDTSVATARFDQDTIAALSQLGFSNPDILRVLETLPKDLATTEERVTAALRSL